MQETLVQFLGWEDPVFLGFPRGSTGKESAYNMGDLGLMPGLRRFPGEGKGYSLHNPGLENSMDYIIHGVAKSQTRLSDFHFHFFIVSQLHVNPSILFSPQLLEWSSSKVSQIDIMTKWLLSQGCKDSSVFANQLM